MTGPALTRLARFVAEDSLAADSATVSVVRDGVIDAIGCIHAGVGIDVAIRARAAVSAMGSEGPVRVIGTQMSAARPQAAFLNTIAGHALDFDDWEIPGNTHPTIVILPALLAVAARNTTGQELVTAYLAGFEVIARLGEMLNFDHYDKGWHSTATLGAIGAAAAAARLLGCGTEQMTNALSLAISSAAGYTCQFGSHAKPVQAGFAARAGVEAALLAANGINAQAHVLDHPRGMDALTAGAGSTRINDVLDRLGGALALSEYGLVLKPWPSCGYTHRIMTCALRLRERVEHSRIVRIDLHLPDFHAKVLPFEYPTSRNEALFSAAFVAAMGLVHGGLSLTDMEATPWKDPGIKRLIDVTNVEPFHPRQPHLNYSEQDPDRMILTIAGGEQLSETCVYPTGAPQAQMTEAMLWSKFTANSGPVDQDWIERLRHWPDAAGVLDLLTEEGPTQ